MITDYVKPTGATIMMFWLLSGFSFFGKNIVNIWPVILGGYLYAKFRKESFSKYAVVTMLATSFSPFAALIILGLFLGKNNNKNIKQILRRTGRLTSAFYLDYGESCYINMGILGLFATFSVLLLGGNINGPVMR